MAWDAIQASPMARVLARVRAALKAHPPPTGYQVNLAGLPGICLPGGFTPDGLPLGLQLIAPHFAEAALLQAAHAFEQATDYHTRRPPLA